MTVKIGKADRMRQETMKTRIVSEDKLNESKERRERWEQEFGFRPTSIWKIGHKANFGHDRELQKIMGETVASDSYITGNISQGVILTPNKKSISQFPLELAKRIVGFWSNRGDKVFDPFSGMGERMQITAYMGRDYYGYDISKKFHLQKEQLRNAESSFKFDGERNLYLRDSRMVEFPDNYFDLVMTSPPYYDVEVKAYGDEPEQLGYAGGYDSFLNEYEKCIKESIRVLKNGKYIAWIVGDFRKNGRLFSYHSDTISLFEKNGAVLHDLIIYEVGTLAAAFLKPLIEQKRMGKTHEYILIFKKHSEP